MYRNTLAIVFFSGLRVHVRDVVIYTLTWTHVKPRSHRPSIRGRLDGPWRQVMCATLLTRYHMRGHFGSLNSVVSAPRFTLFLANCCCSHCTWTAKRTKHTIAVVCTCTVMRFRASTQYNGGCVWVSEQSLTSHSTLYRSFRGRFLQARWP